MNPTLPRALLLALCLFTSACSEDPENLRPVPPPAPEPQAEYRPLVFVHGQSGSAQQFEVQAMRFTSNGYPQDLLFAFEYDTSREENPVADLDAFVDEVLAGTGESEVYAIGHSRGTSLWVSYLEDPELAGADKVARYVNIEGRSPEAEPGGVPTIGIWGEWNAAGSGFNRREDQSDAQIGPEPENNFHFPAQAHTEVATSPEAFELMYRFLTGVEADTLAVTEATAGTVAVAGRVLLFPENVGYEGVELEVWPVDSETGQRSGDAPVFGSVIGAGGDFGPFDLEVQQRYEFALLREATQALPLPSVHHFYFEPFYHDNHFLRLQSSIPGSSIEAFIPAFEDSASLVIQRQKEFWGDQGSASDQLFVNGVDILADAIAPRRLGEGTGSNVVVFAFDADGDNVTDLERGELFPFNLLTFLSGADVFMPAEPGAAGVTELTLVHRGGAQSQLNVPNWPSTDNRVSVAFREDL